MDMHRYVMKPMTSENKSSCSRCLSCLTATEEVICLRFRVVTMISRRGRRSSRQEYVLLCGELRAGCRGFGALVRWNGQ